MIGEVSLYGLYVPTLLLLAIAGALVVSRVLGKLLARWLLPPGVAPGAVRFFAVRHRAGQLLNTVNQLG
jgi:hypothetical protein